VIRDVTLDDAASVAALLGDLGYPTDADVARSRLTKLAGRADYALRLFVDGNDVLGFIALTLVPTLHEDTPVVQASALVVRKAARDRGIGRALLGEAERVARGHGVARITLTSRVDRVEAHASYEACGFEHTGVRFTRRLSA